MASPEVKPATIEKILSLWAKGYTVPSIIKIACRDTGQHYHESTIRKYIRLARCSGDPRAVLRR